MVSADAGNGGSVSNDLIDQAALAERVRVWAESPEGQRELQESAAEVAATVEELKRNRRIDPEELRKPMDI